MGTYSTPKNNFPLLCFRSFVQAIIIIIFEHLQRAISLFSSLNFQGPYTREDGFLGYNEICEELMDTDDTESWTVEWEDHHKAPYMHKGVKWVSYDNQDSIRYDFT